MLVFGIYLTLISLLAIRLSIKDKSASKYHQWRVSERTLLMVGFLGGALAMYITFQMIRHKTKHNKFMIGLPLMIFCHLFLLMLYYQKLITLG